MMNAIADLTAEHGYEATKIADIVRQAGVARKTLYDNFDGKEDLFLAAIDYTLRDLKEAVAEACRGADGLWQQRVEAGLAAFLRFVDERPGAAKMCMIEALSATRASSARYDAALRDFIEMLRQGTPGGDDLPETIEETLVGGVAWVVNQRIRRGTEVDAAALLPELSEFVLSPYLGVAETGKRK